MDTEAFISAYREVNSRLLSVMDSMSSLRELSQLEVSGIDEDQLINESLRILLTNQPLHLVCVYLLDHGQLEFKTCLSWDGGTQAVEREQFHELNDIAAAAAQQGDAQYSSLRGAALCIPILTQESTLGVCCIHCTDAESIDLALERALQIFCNFFAQRLLNNRLIHKVEAVVRERTALLEKALQEADELRIRYAELSMIDDLTQLHNRRFFYPETVAILERAIRYPQPFALLTLDIDHFKDINDQHGHLAGDQVLKDFAQVLKSAKRTADIVARLGGEEFVMALPETTLAGALIFAARLRERVSALSWRFENTTLQITVTIGVTSLENPVEKDAGVLLNTLLQQADAALYHGKNHGRDQTTSFADIG